MKIVVAATALLFALIPAVSAAPCGPLPYTLTNGQNADASQVMANFNTLLTCIQDAADVAAQNNILLLGLRVASLDGDAVALIDGYADAFANESHVNTAASSNEVYDSAGDYYTNGGMVDRTLGSTIGSMTSYGGLAAGFDGVTNQAASAGAGITTGSGGTIGKDWGSGNTKGITKVLAWRPNDTGMDGTGGSGTITVTLYGSSTGAFGGEETNLGSTTATDYDGAVGSGGAAPSSGWQYIEFTTTATAFRYHRVMISGAGDGARSAEIQFFGSSNMVLLNNAYTATSAPDTARLVIDHQAIDSVTLNTDFTAEVSRDGGTTWTAATLAASLDLGSGRKILTGSADISGQPSGPSMLWRLKTFNGKVQRVYGVSMGWGA